MYNNFQNEETIGKEYITEQATRAFVAQVFGWMFGALLITAGIAFAFANIPSLTSILFDAATAKPTAAFWIATFSPIAVVMAVSIGLDRMSTALVASLYILYSALLGVSLCVIFLAFDPLLIVKAFALTAGTFGIMAILGYTTKTDLTRFGSILMIGVFGIVVSMIINWFMHSSGFSYLIDIACLVVFTGLVAFKMQQIKTIGQQVGTSRPKLAIWGALTLYITFINLFLTILRLLGSRR
ncbi:MAG TPA: Bax inhibitor-1/YccA family protein [Bacteroidia bacterium]|nr:Bax inhibitor-1/YccA family protein [Bacteroidia bacterium]